MSKPITLKVNKAPDEVSALKNAVFINPSCEGLTTTSGIKGHSKYVELAHSLSKITFTFTVVYDARITVGEIGVNGLHRKWAQLSFGQPVTIKDVTSTVAQHLLAKIAFEVEPLNKNKRIEEALDAKDLSSTITNFLGQNVFNVDELIAFEFKGINFQGKVKEISIRSSEQLSGEGEDLPIAPYGPNGQPPYGIFNKSTACMFIKSTDATIKIVGSEKMVQQAPIIDPKFKFEELGIGGLDEEFKQIFRRAFASRIFPAQIIAQMGTRHVKGLLLFGPPGTGKTLMARQIGRLLQAREPKIVNGPEILNKYVGQAEENIRNLFKDAEIEYKAKGEDSGLHIIIFDEIDAICKQRGSRSDSTGVGDSVVNQLLSKMDGVEQLNNILIIGMTNRKDMLDEALLRPGRFEVQVEITLPNEAGRVQIFNIQTAEMKKNKRLGDDVNTVELARQAKNFSGAEIQGLVNSAMSFAMNSRVDPNNMARFKESDLADLKVRMADFERALGEVKPAFGATEEDFNLYGANASVIEYSDDVVKLQTDAMLYAKQAENSTRTRLVSLLLHGHPGAGKTSVASVLAQQCLKSGKFPFVKFITPDKLVAYNESAKCSMINKIFDDAFKTERSLIIVDNIERLIEYVPLGQRFSNAVLQTLSVLLTRNPPAPIKDKDGKIAKDHRVFIIATTSNRELLEQIGMTHLFSGEMFVPNITEAAHVIKVAEEYKFFESDSGVFNSSEKAAAQSGIGKSKVNISVKRLLNIIEKARQDPVTKVEKFVHEVNMVSTGAVY